MDTWTTLTRKAERRHGIVTAEDLLANGISRRRTRRLVELGRLVDCGYGTFRIAGSPPSFAGTVLAAILAFEGDTWASHYSAARLQDLRIWGRDDRVELLRPASGSNERGSALVHRSNRILDWHVTVIDGIPCTTVSRTIFDLARTTGPKVLKQAIDRGLLLRTCTIASLWRVSHELGGRGRPGTRRMREILEELGLGYVPPESELEVVGMALLDGFGFSWQVERSDERGYIRRVDGLHPSTRLVVEFDGEQHRREPQRSHDEDGDRRLGLLGYEVIRLDWAAVTTGADETIERITARLASAAA